MARQLALAMVLLLFGLTGLGDARVFAQVSTVPVSVDKAFSARADTPFTLSTPGVMLGDSAPAATAAIVTPPANGTVSLAPTGGFTFTPSPGFVGTTSFTYRATNPSGAGNVATVTVTVRPAGVPQANRDTYAADQGVPLTIPAPGVLGNDVGASGLPLTATLGPLPQPELTLKADGGFTFRPDPGFSGTYVFGYQASNSLGTSDPQLAIITVAPSPSLPQAPAGLFAHALDGNRLTLQWTPPVGGLAPTSYVVEGGVSPGQTLAQVATLGAIPALTLNVPNGTFYVRVRTVASGRTSSPSNEIRVSVNQPSGLPTGPTRLLGLVNGSTVELSWRNTVGSGGATGVVLDVAGPISASLPIGDTERFTFDGVPAGTYSFSVRSASAPAIGLFRSNFVLLTFPGACSGVPVTPPSFVAFAEGRTLTLLWDPFPFGPAVSSYLVTASGAANGAFPVDGRRISASVPPGTYTLTVSAVNACGASTPTPAQTVVVP